MHSHTRIVVKWLCSLLLPLVHSFRRLYVDMFLLLCTSCHQSSAAPGSIFIFFCFGAVTVTLALVQVSFRSHYLGLIACLMLCSSFCLFVLWAPSSWPLVTAGSCPQLLTKLLVVCTFVLSRFSRLRAERIFSRLCGLPKVGEAMYRPYCVYQLTRFEQIRRTTINVM